MLVLDSLERLRLGLIKLTIARIQEVSEWCLTGEGRTMLSISIFLSTASTRVASPPTSLETSRTTEHCAGLPIDFWSSVWQRLAASVQAISFWDKTVFRRTQPYHPLDQLLMILLVKLLHRDQLSLRIRDSICELCDALDEFL